MRRARRSLFGRCWPRVSSTRATVKADVVHRYIVDDSFVVNIRNVVDVVDRTVVVEVSSIPISAFIAGTDIAEAIENPAIETHLWSPVTGIPNISFGLPDPISRSPKHPDRGEYPGARHPIVSIISIGPISGRPNVTFAWTNWLLVNGQGRRTNLYGDTHSNLCSGLNWNHHRYEN